MSLIFLGFWALFGKLIFGVLVWFCLFLIHLRASRYPNGCPVNGLVKTLFQFYRIPFRV